MVYDDEPSVGGECAIGQSLDRMARVATAGGRRCRGEIWAHKPKLPKKGSYRALVTAIDARLTELTNEHQRAIESRDQRIVRLRTRNKTLRSKLKKARAKAR